MSGIAVFDSSAYLALIQRERGADIVTRVLRGALVCAVNVAEVQGKLMLKGMSEEIASWHIDTLNCECVPFDRELARVTGSLVSVTKDFGLSLGDRACLALAMERKATAYTTDRVWKKLDLGIQIEVIR